MMADNLRLCPICNEGYMRPISEIAADFAGPQAISNFRSDNEYCKYRRAETGITPRCADWG